MIAKFKSRERDDKSSLRNPATLGSPKIS